jgi:hypothetical protein
MHIGRATTNRCYCTKVSTDANTTVPKALASLSWIKVFTLLPMFWRVAPLRCGLPLVPPWRHRYEGLILFLGPPTNTLRGRR